MTEFRLFDAPGSTVAEITTNGDTIKPFINAIDPVAKEARFRIHEDGITVEVVDSANVYMTRTHLHADAFDTYDCEQETTVGVNITGFKSLVRRARKHHNDKLTLSFKEREVSATVSRGYDNHNVVSQGTHDLMDPGALREPPEIPDLDYALHVEVDTSPFVDALSYAVGASDCVEMSVKGVNQHANALYLGGETDTRSESAAIDGIECEDTGTAIYSGEYISGILDGVSGVGAEKVEVWFGDELPAKVHVSSDALDVQYLVAPRITSD